jgi:protein SCO1/2
MLGGMLRILVVGLVVLVAAMFMMPRAPSPPVAASVLPEPRPLPAVELVDAAGAPLGLDAFRGRFSLLYFGFTRCPDVCPLTLKVLADARADLAARAPQAVPQVVFVSVDPGRDTPAAIADYLGHFDRAFVGATAPADRLTPLTAALGVTIEKHRHGDDDYTVTHNDTVYVIGPAAELIAVTSDPRDAATVAADFLKIRQRYRASHRAPA